jgi:glycosyltransferase involved in cell wall biosynthesis
MAGGSAYAAQMREDTRETSPGTPGNGPALGPTWLQGTVLRLTEGRTSPSARRLRGGVERRLVSRARLADGDQGDVELSRRLGEQLRRPQDAVAWAEILTDAGHPLAGDAVATRFGVVPRLQAERRRALQADLRDRGYLTRSLVYTESLASEGQKADQKALKRRRAERDLLSGAVRPELDPVDVDPVPGRILHVVSESVPQRQNGYTIRTHYTLLAQVAAGLQPHVTTPRGGEVGTVQTDLVDGIPHHRLGLPAPGQEPMTKRLQRVARQLLTVVRDVRPAVLHVHSNFFNALPAEAVGRATGIPVVYEVRGFWELTWLSRTAEDYGWTDYPALVEAFGEPESYAWRRDREADVRAEASHVVTLARTMLPRIEEAGLPSADVTLVPNAVDEAAIKAGDKDPALLEELGIAADETVIGYISSLVAYEGIDVLIEAFASLRDGHPGPVRLVVVGDGVERERLEKLAESLGSTGITFTGQVPHDDVDRYYALIDVFVVPRRPDEVCHLVTPLKPFEAFASGTTLVMSDVAALREIATDSGAAELFEAGNAESLAKVLTQLVDSPDTRADLARRGLEWVREQRTWTANAEVYRQVYGRLGALA